MSRENKYRAWGEDSEVMYYSDAGWNKAHPESEDCIFAFHKGRVVAFLRQTEPGTIDEPPYDYGEPVDVEQSIGPKDKNGQEIEVYEGDVYTWNQPLAKAGRQILKEHKSIATYEMPELCYLHNRAEGGWGGIKVIGNIHTHPELLEK